MPRQPVWKSTEIGLERAATEAAEKASFASDGGVEKGMTGLGAGLGMFARTSAQRKEEERRRRDEAAAAQRAEAKAAQLEAAKKAAARRLSERKVVGSSRSAHDGAGTPLSLAYSGQPTTFCPDDDAFLYRKHAVKVALDSVAPIAADECNISKALSTDTSLHVVMGPSRVALPSSLCRGGSNNIANRENSPPQASSAATGIGRGRSKKDDSSWVTAPPFPLHATQKGALHRDLLYRLFYLDKQKVQEQASGKAAKASVSTAPSSSIKGDMGHKETTFR